MNRQFRTVRILTCTVLLSVSVFMVSLARADLVSTDWTSFTSSSSTGVLDGTSISGSIISGPGFNGIYTGQFSGPGWLAGHPLPESAESIGGEGAAGGNQFFQFSRPISYLRFYVDNFDSGAAATITANGATLISLIGNSPSMSYTPLTASTGNLVTSNFSFNGEGDAILELTGSITSFRLQYYSGTLGNFVGYTFATNAVPEPGALGFLATTVAIGMTRLRRRSRG